MKAEKQRPADLLATKSRMTTGLAARESEAPLLWSLGRAQKCFTNKSESKRYVGRGLDCKLNVVTDIYHEVSKAITALWYHDAVGSIV